MNVEITVFQRGACDKCNQMAYPENPIFCIRSTRQNYARPKLQVSSTVYICKTCLGRAQDLHELAVSFISRER